MRFAFVVVLLRCGDIEENSGPLLCVVCVVAAALARAPNVLCMIVECI